MSIHLAYFHIIWSTRKREPLLSAQKEEAVFRCAMATVKKLSHEVIAINGTADHVHMLVKCGPVIDMPVLMKQVKGVTSTLVNDMPDRVTLFRWQEGYCSLTVTPSHVPRISEYVQNQKDHHRANTLHAAWEQIDE